MQKSLMGKFAKVLVVSVLQLTWACSSADQESQDIEPSRSSHYKQSSNIRHAEAELDKDSTSSVFEVHVETPDLVKQAQKSLRAEITRLGARVVEETSEVREDFGKAHFELDVPTKALDEFTEFVRKQGVIVNERISRVNVARALAKVENDQQRIRSQMKSSANIDQSKQIEFERSLQDLERKKESFKALTDTASVVIDISSQQKWDNYRSRHALLTGFQFANVLLVNSEKSKRTYNGGGVFLSSGTRVTTASIKGLSRPGSDKLGLLATLAFGGISDLIGTSRPYLRPFAHGTISYGSFEGDGSTYLGVDLGLELIRSKYVAWDVFAHGMGKISSRAGLAVELGSGIAVPF